MNIGDYARTKKGIIGKIKAIDNQTELEDLYLVKRRWYYKEDIIKSSPNIKNLIETGDFITYRHINMYWLIPTSVYAKYKENETTLMVDDYTLNEIEILSIVTKEQFESMEYKINE